MLSGDGKMIRIVNQLVGYIEEHGITNIDASSNIFDKEIQLNLSEFGRYWKIYNVTVDRKTNNVIIRNCALLCIF